MSRPFVTFGNTATARDFCRRYAGKGVMAGSAFWSPEKMRNMAERLARQMSAEDVAYAIKSMRGKSVKFHGVYCSRCGSALTAAESVAAGIGPECQQKMAG